MCRKFRIVLCFDATETRGAFFIKPPQPKFSRFWQARFATLFRKLTQTPTAEDAWFWKVQCHIIHYLLHRYGDTEMRLPADS
jgi:hypothetical protein